MVTDEAVKNTDSNSHGFIKFVGTVSAVSGWIAAGMIMVAVAITCQMIFVRSVLNQSTVWQTEAVVYLVVAATLLGLPYVQKLRGHVNVDLIPLYLPLPLRRALHIFTLTLSVIIIAIMVFYGYEYWHIAYERNWKSDTIWGVRLWIPYLALPVGFGLLALQLIADLLAIALRVDKPFWIDGAR